MTKQGLTKFVVDIDQCRVPVPRSSLPCEESVLGGEELTVNPLADELHAGIG